LVEEEVREILKLIGKESNAVIAKKFGVSRRNISFIANGTTWSWIKEEGEE